MRFRDMPLQNFINTLGNDQPTPGGGSAAAVVTAMGAALLRMYALISARSKKVNPENQALCQEIAMLVQPLYEKALALADKDTEAYDRVVAAFRLPKETEEEKKIRRRNIVEATIQAARVPLDTAETAQNVIEHCHQLKDKGTPFALSDLETAYQLARAGLIGALENVAINLEGLDETARPDDLVASFERLRSFLSDLPTRLTG